MRPLIHIGYHKTGSTWLQRQVFRPDMGFDPLLSQQDLDRHIVTPHCLDFDPNLAKNAANSGLRPVLSSENLSGHPFFGGRDSAVFAHRLHRVWPEADILIVVRSQRTMLPSVYMQYLKRGGTLAARQFFSQSTGVNYPGFDPRHFEYDRLIALYQSLFQTVIVKTYETLARDPSWFAASLLSAANCPPRPLPADRNVAVGASPSSGATALLRHANRVRRSTLNPAPLLELGQEGGRFDKALFALSRRLPRSDKLARFVDRELAPLYTQSNARLQDLVEGIDLTGYP